MMQEVSGAEARKIAGRLIRTMHRRKDDRNITITAETMEDIRTLAGSVLTQSPDLKEAALNKLLHITPAGIVKLREVYKSGGVAVHRVGLGTTAFYLHTQGLIDFNDDGNVALTPVGLMTAILDEQR